MDDIAVGSLSALATLELEWKQRGLLESEEEVATQNKAFDAMIKVTGTLVGKASSAASDIQTILDSNSNKETRRKTHQKTHTHTQQQLKSKKAEAKALGPAAPAAVRGHAKAAQQHAAIG